MSFPIPVRYELTEELNNTRVVYNNGDSLEMIPTDTCINIRELMDGGTVAWVKVIGFNQWDEEWELGVLAPDGSTQQASNAIRSKNYIPVIQGQTYYIYINPMYTNRLILRTYDAEKVFVSTVSISGSSASRVYTIPSGVSYIKFCTYSVDNITTYNHDICLNISDPSRNGTYEPYVEVTKGYVL